MKSVWDVIVQAAGFVNEATRLVYGVLMVASDCDAPINVFTFSGGAAAFNAAYDVLPDDI